MFSYGRTIIDVIYILIFGEFERPKNLYLNSPQLSVSLDTSFGTLCIRCLVYLQKISFKDFVDEMVVGYLSLYNQRLPSSHLLTLGDSKPKLGGFFQKGMYLVI